MQEGPFGGPFSVRGGPAAGAGVNGRVRDAWGRVLHGGLGPRLRAGRERTRAGACATIRHDLSTYLEIVDKFTVRRRTHTADGTPYCGSSKRYQLFISFNTSV